MALPLYYDGRRETLEEWLAWFSDEELVRYPALAVNGAWLRAMTGHAAEAERWLALAEGRPRRSRSRTAAPRSSPWVATLRARMMADGVERASPTPTWR